MIFKENQKYVKDCYNHSYILVASVYFYDVGVKCNLGNKCIFTNLIWNQTRCDYSQNYKLKINQQIKLNLVSIVNKLATKYYWR